MLGSEQRKIQNEAMVKEFNQVFGMKVNGLTSKVTSVGAYDKKIVVYGEVRDASGQYVGKFERQLTRQASGFVVEHKLLKLAEEAQGKGFAKRFIPMSEAYYINNGFKRIDVFTGWDGARHWARAGYDFNPGKRAMKSTFTHLALYAGARGFTDNSTPSGHKFNELMSKASPDWQVNPLTGQGRFTTSNPTFHPRGDSFPIPNDFATIGYTRGAKSWDGKTLLNNLNLYYSKPLTAKGMNVKTR
jgi:GNAT superfamily N-acetyltransferase